MAAVAISKVKIDAILNHNKNTF
jgi:hypothetical protein